MWVSCFFVGSVPCLPLGGRWIFAGRQKDGGREKAAGKTPSPSVFAIAQPAPSAEGAVNGEMRDLQRPLPPSGRDFWQAETGILFIKICTKYRNRHMSVI